MKLALLAMIVAAGVSQAAAQANIRRVDFANFRYRPLCAGQNAMPVTVKNREFSRETPADGYTDRFYFRVKSPVYGDVNNDGAEEAIILSVCNSGGSGQFSEGFVYGIRRGQAVLLARIPGGDRAFGGLRDARVEMAQLVVESNDAGKDGAACCPQIVVTNRYQVMGGKLKSVGREERREIFPKESVRFARGKTSVMLAVTVAPYEGRRYIVAARAGQTLSVKTNSDKAEARLLEDAIVTEGVNGFTAKLSKDGDYTIEVWNVAETELPIRLMIAVQ